MSDKNLHRYISSPSQSDPPTFCKEIVRLHVSHQYLPSRMGRCFSWILLSFNEGDFRRVIQRDEDKRPTIVFGESPIGRTAGGEGGGI